MQEKEDAGQSSREKSNEDKDPKLHREGLGKGKNDCKADRCQGRALPKRYPERVD